MASSFRPAKTPAPRDVVRAVASLFTVNELARNKDDSEDLSPVGSYALALLMASGIKRGEALESIKSVFVKIGLSPSG